MNGILLEKLVIQSLSREYKVITSKWLDHKCKTDLIVVDGDMYYAIQLKWNGGIADTHPIKSEILNRFHVEPNRLRCLTMHILGMAPEPCNPHKFIKICRGAKDGDTVKVNGFTWEPIKG